MKPRSDSMTNKPQVVIADDQFENRFILEELLAPHYEVRSFEDGAQVLEGLVQNPAADLFLLDVVMPRMNGYEVCRHLKADPKTRDLPVLFISSLESSSDEEYGLSLGAEDFIHKPFSPPVVLVRIRNHLKLAQNSRELRERNENLEELVRERTQEVLRKSEELVRSSHQLAAAQGATITAFCSLAEARDNETGNHIRRTQNYVRALAEGLRHHPRFERELDDATIQLLFKSAPLHDVGKVAIPDAILLKPGKLTPEEWVIMKTHCQAGHDAILSAERELGESGAFMRYAREIALGHHERWDGTGYPNGLAGDAIPLSARLMAAADVYDALISKRVYKPPFSHEQAIGIMRDGRGTHFDPDVLDCLLAIEGEFRGIARRFNDDD
ncbi:MAG: two-component system response regulator [Gammaproteobacteria bacterium RIFOXYA12_FULL_61_12]|nr:MAG: two-component system response regulator [Gammaproteobacteria bacterium RIFOXYA12_FULL_61_12]OGT91468.1 MAG: two-component system response regulator [Gammaproteobacteria bacterium RIFOXYD12_FULL_61_37]